MNVIKQIMRSYGSMNEASLKQLAAEFPDAQVVIKWGMKQRERVPASEAITKIEKEKDDYVREVFFSATDLESLQVILGS